MFEKLFTYRGTIRRHRNGPLAADRIAYLSRLATEGMARGTILIRSSYCLCVAVELLRWPSDKCFDESEVEDLASAWAERRVGCGRASSPFWPKENFKFVATDFLRSLGRLRPAQMAEPHRYDGELAEFIAAQRESRWLSDATCRSARWQIMRFLGYLEQRGLALEDVALTDVDAFYELMAQRWSRISLRASAKMLRAWFGYCERRGWVRSGFAAGILLPRIYRHEGLPLGPTWDAVGRMLAETNGEDSESIRDHAILLLLSVYGLRSGEVRRLRLDDIDWVHDRIRLVRSKSRRADTVPLEPTVGNAIARYLREGRPKTDSRVVFLTLPAPHRPLSAGGLYHIVARHFSNSEEPKKGRGPHGLRHACARHLVEAGRNFKEVGDHLGHRSPDATRFYAKVDLASLRRVAFDDLGGLA
ncbi:MAG: tyrosine-type recombinase/integrase [Anaerolineae bacterium]|jgi:site-specific recombinase XerD|nr:tyrosine-type recombinase/integrase [Anaerolineae bacterium]